jgi:hypothetical protein
MTYRQSNVKSPWRDEKKGSHGAYQQLEGLETEYRESGTVYSCPPGQHDDLGISCAMLAWAARHPHVSSWVGTALASRRPRKPRQKMSWGAWTR